MKKWLLMLQIGLISLIVWQVWSISQCKNFNTFCEDCAGVVYNPDCGAECSVGQRLDDEAYTCCCPTTTRTGYSACCEGKCVRWQCENIPLIPADCNFTDVEFMGVVGMKTSCKHKDGGRDMEGYCTSGGPGSRCP